MSLPDDAVVLTLEHPLTLVEAERLRAEWRGLYGAKSAGKLLILQAGVKLARLRPAACSYCWRALPAEHIGSCPGCGAPTEGAP